MNNHLLSGARLKLKGFVKETWAKLTDDQTTRLEGQVDQQVGDLATRCGRALQNAEAPACAEGNEEC